MATSRRRSPRPASLGAQFASRPRTMLLEDRTVPATITPGPNINMGALAGNQNEAAIAINPTNPDNIVAVANDESLAAGLRFYRSIDAGETWTNRVIGVGDGLGTSGCCDGQLVFDDFGNLFMVFLDFGAAAITTNVITSADGGATLTRVATLGNNVDQPSISAGGGSVWVSWNQGLMRASGAPVTGLGAIGAFSPPATLPNANGNFGNTAVGPDGQVIVTYQSPVSGAGPSTIFMNTDPDGLGPMPFRARVNASSTQVGGFRFIPALDSSHGIDAEANVYYDLSTGPNSGRAYLVYLDAPSVASNDINVFVRFSDDDGATWSAAVRVNDDTGTTSQFLPSGAVDRTTGNFAVGWMDARNSPANNTAQYFVTVTIDGGATFLPSVQVATGLSNWATSGADVVGFGDYLSLDFHNGIIHPVWADNTNMLTPPNTGLPAFDLATSAVVFDDGGGPGPGNLIGNMLVGADAGSFPLIRLMDLSTSISRRDIMVFDNKFRGGVRVAYADVNGDGTVDLIAAAGFGGGPHVKVYDGTNYQPLQSPLGSFMAYDLGFTGGVYVAAGDYNGDGLADIITGAGLGGGPHVKVFNAADGSLIKEFMAYESSFRGGVTVAAGDTNLDGLADIITGPGIGGGPYVKVFSAATGNLARAFFAYGQSFRGGIFVATGDFNADGAADIVTGAGAGGGSHVRVFNGTNGRGMVSLFAFSNQIGSTQYVGDSLYSSGVRVGAIDADGDGIDDIMAGTGSGGRPMASIIAGNGTVLGTLNVFDPDFLGGIFVA